MAETAAPTLTFADEEAVSRDLTSRAAAVAVQIAQLLETTCSEGSGAPAAASFLRSYATVATSLHVVGRHSTPLDLLTDRYGLHDIEQTLLLLAGLAEEHEGVASTFRTLHPLGMPRPTVGLAAQLVASDHGDRAALRRVLAEGAATRSGLLELVGDATYYERSLVLGERLWDALHGHDSAWPARLGRVAIETAPPAGLETWIDLAAVRRVRVALSSVEERTLLVTTADETVAASRASALAASVGRNVVGARLDTPDNQLIMLAVAHAACRGAVPVLFLRALPDGGPSIASPLDLAGCPGPIIVCAPPGAVRPSGPRPVLTIPLGPISTRDRRRAWQVALPDLADSAADVAGRHPLDPAMTVEVAADVRSRQRVGGGLNGVREISDVIRARAGASLPSGVRMSAPDVAWSRLVLPDDSLEQLHDAVGRLKHQATVLDDWAFIDEARADRGVRVMLTGPPGTGKSFAAEVIATAAGTDLLVADVSQIVSKWIGETEKNLAGIFDVAERMQAVLFLDEADALFATRTEVSDAHDRYANLQTAYLLQRLDHFDGLTILATNLRQNIDPAFVRRMDVVVEFSVPDVGLRHRLWNLHLPSRAPIAGGVDVDLLAHLYPVPGAWIRNSTIGAAFLAAAEGSPIDLGHLHRSMRREYDKAARPFPGPSSVTDAGQIERSAAQPFTLAGTARRATGEEAR